MAQLLLENGANVNSVDMFNLTPLMATCHFVGNIEIVKLLLDNGADLNVVDSKYGLTALMFALNNGSKDIAELLLEKKPDATSMNKTGIEKAKKEMYEKALKDNENLEITIDSDCSTQ